MNSTKQVAGKGLHWTALFAGDSALILEFGQRIDSAIVDQVNAFDGLVRKAIDNSELNGVLETVPTFRSLAIVYDPSALHPLELIQRLKILESASQSGEYTASDTRQWRLPVLYGTEHGPDLDSVASLTGLSCDEVIHLHASTTYTAYMLGFLPGYAFLGDTPTQLHLPRRTEPRLRVPSGSVAIALQLTGIYPWESPGGWHILGNCPVPMFSARLSPPALLKAGDQISFYSINLQEFENLRSELEHSEPDHSRWASSL